jgi:hypothetical protein
MLMQINMDPTLLMLVAKLELLVQQQEDDVRCLPLAAWWCVCIGGPGY